MIAPGSVLRIALAAVLVSGVAKSSAQCLPSGRKTFAAGLEALSAGDLVTAAKSFYLVVEKQPGCAEARNNLAVVFVEQGRLEEAAAQLRAAAEARPDYQLARRNLDRLDALLAARKAGSGTERRSAPEPVADAGTPAPTQWRATEVVSPTTTPPPTNAAPASAAGRPSVEAQPRPATVCIIDPTQNRICIREAITSDGAAMENCYPIRAAQVSAWPRWLIASELTTKRIRLRDETGQARLEIVAGDMPVTSDALRLDQTDFDSLAGKVVPWRTKWVVLE